MDKFKLQCVNLTICVAIVTLLPTCITETMQSQNERDILASTEIPVDHIDPASIDLTPLINALLNATNTDSQNLFSVLSVTSHSSLALHKITILVYNISDFQDIETSTFPLRYCYCVTNKTNDLTDFTAILLDVMGNSTSYLQELFKSSSFLSVNQRRDSDCIYICVLAGKTDRNLTELWDSVPPLFNQTFVETAHKGNISFLESFFVSSTDFTTSEISFPSKSPVITEVPSPTSIPSTVLTRSHMSSFYTPTPTNASTTVIINPPAAATTIPTSPAIPIMHSTQLELLTGSTGIAVAKTTTETHVSVASKTLTKTSTVDSTISDVTVTTSRSTRAATELLLKTSADITNGQTTVEAVHTEEPATTADSTRNILTTSRAAYSAIEILPKTPAAITTSPVTGKAIHTEEPGCPWRSELFYRSQIKDLKKTPDEDLNGNSPTISTIKLQPCVFELCKFFSQCLCRGLKQKSTLWRYCVSSHFWYEKHTLEICSRVKRVTFSKNLKQKCLSRMCGM